MEIDEIKGIRSAKALSTPEWLLVQVAEFTR